MSRVRLVPALVLASLIALWGSPLDAGAVTVPIISTQVTISPGASGSGAALSVEDVSCVSAGNCTAVGSLADPSSGTVAPVAVVETRGTWGDPVAITLPEGAVDSGALNGLIAVQCFANADCVAVGRFANSASNTTTAMTTEEVGGVWTPGLALGQPANGSASVSAWLTGLSCTTVDACTAVGTYFDASDLPVPMVTSETNGTWQLPSEIQMAASDQPVQGGWSISCSAASTCTAVGTVGTGAGDEAAAASEANGVWSGVSAVSSTPGTEISDVSCEGEQCVAVGDEASANSDTAMLFNDANGSWSETVVNPSPKSAGASSALESISCVSAGDCYAAGDVTTGTGVFALAEENGQWTQTISIPVAGESPSSIIGITGLSCSAALSCVAVGEVGTSSANLQSVAWTSSAARARHTISCRRGRQLRRVTGVNPRCPAGYKKI